jgi:hypothetical protein
VGLLDHFFEPAFAAARALGLSAFAMLVITAILAIVVAVGKGSRVLVAIFGALALASVVGLVILNTFHPPPPPARAIPPGSPAPSAQASSPRCFDARILADRAGADRFYGAGDVPVYQADGTTLCDDNSIGQVATCWQSRPANSTSMAAGVPTNIDISQKRTDWCAYKDGSVTLATRPTGATPGHVYVCARSIAP